ncbi:hypothetical protein ACAD17_003897 [Enterobacter ludwigii]
MNLRIVVQHFRMPVSLRRENVHNPIAVALSDSDSSHRTERQTKCSTVRDVAKAPLTPVR